jgi:Amt family ammonium transporter
MTRFLYILLVMALFLAVAGPSLADGPSDSPVTKKQLDEAKDEAIKSGDTAWMLTSTGLVLLMVPGLALFYGGMVRRKNVLGTMMHSMVALAIIGLQWLLFGYSLAFGLSQSGWIGWSGEYLGLSGVWSDQTYPGTHIPIFVHCMYQGMFAIITPALISGALAERIRFGPYCVFIFLWATLVYDPLAHWVWAVDSEGHPAGWLGKMGALDFAGGTVVHIAAGLSGLAAFLMLRKRIGYPEHAIHPNSMVLTLLGAGILWFGWFGFNGGSALASNGLAGAALAASQAAAAAAALSWMVVEWFHRGKPTALGFASGLVAGLVAVTPASGFVTPLAAVAIGLAAGVVCYVAVSLKPFFKYDDSLDAFGVHGVGGFLGAILTGFFASAVLYQHGSGSSDPVGKLADGTLAQVGVQLLAALVAVVYSFVVSVVLVKAIDMTMGFCLEARAEGEGLDRNEHGEVGFDLGLALESTSETAPQEPRAAAVPPNGDRRFTVVIQGAKNGDLIHAWSNLCQVRSTPPSAEFKAVYPYVTTVQGNRFRFRGGDSKTMRSNLERLFQDNLDGTAIRAHVEA